MRLPSRIGIMSFRSTMAIDSNSFSMEFRRAIISGDAAARPWPLTNWSCALKLRRRNPAPANSREKKIFLRMRLLLLKDEWRVDYRAFLGVLIFYPTRPRHASQ